MSRREKIILSITLCAVGYAAATFLFSRAPKTTSFTESSDTMIQEFVMEVAQGLAAYDITETELIILKKTQLPWSRQPFVSGPIPLAATAARAVETATALENAEFKFNGYVEFGTKRMAIINDAEYEEGDQVEKSTFTVVNILSNQVELKNLENETIIIPLLDMDDGQHTRFN